MAKKVGIREADFKANATFSLVSYLLEIRPIGKRLEGRDHDERKVSRQHERSHRTCREIRRPKGAFRSFLPSWFAGPIVTHRTSSTLCADRGNYMSRRKCWKLLFTASAAVFSSLLAVMISAWSVSSRAITSIIENWTPRSVTMWLGQPKIPVSADGSFESVYHDQHLCVFLLISRKWPATINLQGFDRAGSRYREMTRLNWDTQETHLLATCSRIYASIHVCFNKLSFASIRYAQPHGVPRWSFALSLWPLNIRWTVKIREGGHQHWGKLRFVRVFFTSLENPSAAKFFLQ